MGMHCTNDDLVYGGIDVWHPEIVLSPRERLQIARPDQHAATCDARAVFTCSRRFTAPAQKDCADLAPELTCAVLYGNRFTRHDISAGRVGTY
jgi:hypothetical protein